MEEHFDEADITRIQMRLMKNWLKEGPVCDERLEKCRKLAEAIAKGKKVLQEA